MNFNIINKEICLSVDAIIIAIHTIIGAEFSTILNTIKVGLKRNRKGSERYRHYTDQKDGRKKWIAFDSLPANMQNYLRIHYKDITTACNAELLIDIAKEKVQQEDLKFFMNHKSLTTEQAIELSEACGWIRLLESEEGIKYFHGKMAYYENVAQVISRRSLYGLKLKSGRVLRRKVKAFNQTGRMSLIPKSIGNRNGQKLTELGLKRIIVIYANPRKPTYKAVTALYNREAKSREDWEQMSVDRIRQILQQPKNKQLVFSYRHGEEAYRNKFERTIKRKKASFPDALWSLDGHTIQLRYMDKYGQVKSDLYAISVLDVYSDCVVGYAIGTSENSTLVQAALRNACRSTMMLPYQLQYDNSSANKSGEVNELMQRLARLAFPCQPYNGKSKPIENFIGRLERFNMRHLPNYKGGNITSPNIENKANPDFLKAQTKNRFLPTMDATIAEFELIIGVHNNTKGSDEKTPTERYATPHEERREMDYLTQIEAFWVERTHQVRYTKDGLVMQVNKERYTYEVEKEKGIEDPKFRRQYLGDKFTIKYDPDDLQEINLFQNDVYIATATQKWEAPMAKVDSEKGDGEIIHKALEAKKTERELIRIELEDIQSSVREAGFEELSHELLHKDAYNRMEQKKLDELLDRAGQFTSPIKRKRKRKKTLYESGEASMEKIEI